MRDNLLTDMQYISDLKENLTGLVNHNSQVVLGKLVSGK
jgi:hypothetical protein